MLRKLNAPFPASTTINHSVIADPPTAMELNDAIRKSGHLYTQPDTIYGYGIPDFNLADAILKSESGSLEIDKRANVFPNPFQDEFYVFSDVHLTSSVQVDLFNQSGVKVFSRSFSGYEGLKYFRISKDLGNLLQGIYLMRITTSGFSEYFKLIKHNN